MGSLVPEIHDIGKLVPSDLDAPTTDEDRPNWHGRGAFSSLDWGALGLVEPETTTWLAVRHHHDTIPYMILPQSPAPREGMVDIVLTGIADHLAASASRATPDKTGYGGGEKFTYVHKLWNPAADKRQDQWSPIESLEDLRGLIGFLSRDPDADAFFARYGGWLEATPEDKTPPKVVTSLRTHSELTGKFYQILKRHIEVEAKEGKPVAMIYMDQRADGPETAEKNWRFQLLRCQIDFPQSPVRARDLNVFYLLEEHTDALVDSDYSHYVLFHTTDTFWLCLPLDGSITAKTILKSFLDDGFFFEVQQIIFDLGHLQPDVRSLYEGYKSRQGELEEQREVLQDQKRRLEATFEKLERQLARRPDQGPTLGPKKAEVNRSRGDAVKALERNANSQQRLQEELQELEGHVEEKDAAIYHKQIATRPVLDTTVICDLCQVRPATKTWTDPTGTISEDLCTVCYRVRQAGAPYPKIAEWEEAESDVLTAWVRINLDWDQTAVQVRGLFENFVEGLADRWHEKRKQQSRDEIDTWAADVKARFRPIALLSDFAKDYQDFLIDFERGLRHLGSFSDDDIQEIATKYKDFYVIHLDKAREILNLVDQFTRCLSDWFPGCIDASPIHLSISIAPVKYPFFEHWRYLQKPKTQPVNVQWVGQPPLEVSWEQLRDLKAMKVGRWHVSRFLHNLAQIEARTGSRILVQTSLMEQQRRLPEVVEPFTQGRVDAETILTFFKLMRN